MTTFSCSRHCYHAVIPRQADEIGLPRNLKQIAPLASVHFSQ